MKLLRTRLALRAALKQSLVTLFHAAQRLKIDVLPRHFYSEIPDIAELRNTTTWRKPFSMIGVEGLDLDDQLRFVTGMLETVDPVQMPTIYSSACDKNNVVGFGPIEAIVLYGFVYKHTPRRIIQIGCGVATAVCIAAAADRKYRPEIICVEPYPNDFLRKASAAGEIRLIQAKVQDLPYNFVDVLGAGDLCFIDSTHTLGPAGEVTRIVLEILPRLSPGVFVHFHDIYFPYDYSGSILSSTLYFWHETALLHAFLTYNSRFRVQASLSMLHHSRAQELERYLPSYRPRKMSDGIFMSEGHYPSSIYLSTEGPRS